MWSTQSTHFPLAINTSWCSIIPKHGCSPWVFSACSLGRYLLPENIYLTTREILVSPSPHGPECLVGRMVLSFRLNSSYPSLGQKECRWYNHLGTNIRRTEGKIPHHSWEMQSFDHQNIFEEAGTWKRNFICRTHRQASGQTTANVGQLQNFQLQKMCTSSDCF